LDSSYLKTAEMQRMLSEIWMEPRYVAGESEWSILEAQEEMAVVVAEVEEEEVLHRLIG